jgi:subtilisin family serine protease
VRVNPDNGDVATAGQAVASAAGLTYTGDIGNGFVVMAAKGEVVRANAARVAIVAAMERSRGGGGPPDTTPLGQAVAAAKVSSAEEDFILLPMAAPTECAAAGGCVSGTGGSGLWGMNYIRAPALWNSLPGAVLPTSELHKGGVIDTGVHFSHVELAGQLNSTLSRGYKGSDTPTSAADLDGHGTHVSGSMAARWNSGGQGSLAGVVGTADLVACKFLWGSQGGTTSDAVRCLNYLRTNGILITNNSWGGGGYSSALLTAIQNVCTAGGLFVVAAGNNGANILGSATQYPTYPAAHVTDSIAKDCVLPVAATGTSNTLASFSNFGQEVPIAAPGVGIRSSVYDRKVKNREATWSGTSMAAPHVTGVALMIKNAFPRLTGAQIKTAIVGSTTIQISGIGGGLLDAKAAYDAAAAINAALPSLAP